MAERKGRSQEKGSGRVADADVAASAQTGKEATIPLALKRHIFYFDKLTSSSELGRET